MRLHRLEVTAFGPFADTQHVDFDELSSAGLFLLTGATGAGKSSLLDAVCFALYGTVPGVRGVKSLHSQHAAEGIAPEVVLDVTLQGRRFVVRRRPEWSRPKRRGDGFVTEKAAASILETTSGTEVLLSARAAEVGLLVTSLMGMNAAQFVQVALLPQGEFQTFLRATSQERHDVLQHLFRTDRFARIEDWVHDRSRTLRERAADGQATVRRIVDSVADRCGIEVPEPLTGDTLARSAADDEVRPWLGEQLAAAVTDAARAQTVAEAADAELLHARTALDGATRRREQRIRQTAARECLARLADSADAAAAARSAVAAHQRALQCAPLLELLRAARAGARLAQGGADEQLAALGRAATGHSPSVPGAADLDLTVLAELADRVRARSAALTALLPRERTAAGARRQRALDLDRLHTAERDLEQSRDRASRLPGDLLAAEATLSELAVRAARRELLQLAVTAAAERLRGAVDLLDLQVRLVTTGDALRDARDRHQDAREVAQDLAARRLTGMAAELAGTLGPGVACAVCGSLDHPRPATAGDDVVTVHDQERAEAHLARCATELEAARETARGLEAHRDALAVTAEGLTPEAARSALAHATGELRDAESARRLLADAERSVAALRAELSSLERRTAEAGTAIATLEQSLATHDRVLSEVEAELAAALGEDVDPDATARSRTAGSAMGGRTSTEHALAGLSAVLERVVAAQEALRTLAEAAQRVDSLAGQAETSAREQDFGSSTEVEHALLTRAEHRRLSELLRERDAAEARALAVLEDGADHPDPGAGGGGGARSSSGADATGTDDDLSGMAAALAGVEQAVEQARRSVTLTADLVRALDVQQERLSVALDGWAPARDEFLRADAMSRLVRGLGHDNQLQMRLSAYVLATRLDQVVAAANERLAHMRDQRYLLQRTGRADRRGSQAGLGLEVVDQWTGDVRPPTTLSGGETFVVSLALALGLADVVTHEAGGTEVQTLFVDEGFGTLDADTLDDVMDRLDGLRAGGRTVGVVSHVSELRSRIPTQVQVEKGRSGSTVRVQTLVG